jgi:amino acid permease
MFKNFDTIKAIYTIAATIIGAGILALPVYLGEAGFLPGVIMLVLVGVAAIFSALFIAEIFLRFKEDLHLPKLAQKLLGRPGLYLMFLGIVVYIYGALIGYLSAGGQVIYEISQGRVSVHGGILVYFLLGVVLIYLGLRVVKSVSFILFSLMMFLLVGLVGFTVPHLNFSLLYRADWSVMPLCFGILVFAFTGHSIIPSLGMAMRKNISGFKAVCLWGVLLPFIFYLVWFFILSAAVPYGDTVSGVVDPLLSTTMLSARNLGQPATIPLAHLIGGPILILAVLFTLFATFTSFLGFGLSLKDSYIDIFGKRTKKTTALFLAVLPPLFLAFWHPFSFLQSLEIAGLFGGGVFMGILPALMVLKARQIGECVPEFVAPGGNIAPIAVFLFFLFGLLWKTCSFFL